MIEVFALSWLGVGLLVLPRPERARLLFSAPVGPVARLVLRAIGGLALASALRHGMASWGGGLGFVAALLALMGALSLAVVVWPLRPRWYAFSVAVAALGTAIGAARGS